MIYYSTAQIKARINSHAKEPVHTLGIVTLAELADDLTRYLNNPVFKGELTGVRAYELRAMRTRLNAVQHEIARRAHIQSTQGR